MTIAYFQKASTHQPAESRWDCRFWKAPEVWWSHCSGLTFGNTSWIKDLEDHPIHLFGHICYKAVVLLLYYITYTVILTYIHILIYIHVYVHTHIYIYILHNVQPTIPDCIPVCSVIRYHMIFVLGVTSWCALDNPVEEEHRIRPVGPWRGPIGRGMCRRGIVGLQLHDMSSSLPRSCLSFSSFTKASCYFVGLISCFKLKNPLPSCMLLFG